MQFSLLHPTEQLQVLGSVQFPPLAQPGLQTAIQKGNILQAQWLVSRTLYASGSFPFLSAVTSVGAGAVPSIVTGRRAYSYREEYCATKEYASVLFLVRSVQVGPSHSSVQLQVLGLVQFPPLSQGGWQTAIQNKEYASTMAQWLVSPYALCKWLLPIP